MDVLEQYVGGVLLVAGVALISLPVAMIIAGLLLAAHGALRELTRIDEKEQDGTREPASSDAATRDTSP